MGIVSKRKVDILPVERVPHIPVPAVTGDQALQLGDGGGGLVTSLQLREMETDPSYRFTDSFPSVFESKHG